MKPARKPAPAAALILAAALALAPLAASSPALAAEGKDKDKKPETTYLPFSGLQATVLRTTGSRGVMTVDAGINVPDATLRALAAKSMPRLYDAYALVLGAYGAGLIPGHVPDVDYINRQMQAATDKVLGKPGAQLLLCGVMIN